MSHVIPLGQLASPDAARDAVHIAITPVIIASGPLEPGFHIQLTPDGQATTGPHPIGIIDPFLQRPVKAGERCFILLYPNTITSLRHDWSHPAFPKVAEAAPAAPVAQSAAPDAIYNEADVYGDPCQGCWDAEPPEAPAAPCCPEPGVSDRPSTERETAVTLIRNVADEHGLSYDEMMESARNFVIYGDYRVDGGRWEGMGVGSSFWDAYEIVTGETVPEDKRGGIFSCSC